MDHAMDEIRRRAKESKRTDVWSSYRKRLLRMDQGSRCRHTSEPSRKLGGQQRPLSFILENEEKRSTSRPCDDGTRTYEPVDMGEMSDVASLSSYSVASAPLPMNKYATLPSGFSFGQGSYMDWWNPSTGASYDDHGVTQATSDVYSDVGMDYGQSGASFYWPPQSTSIAQEIPIPPKRTKKRGRRHTLGGPQGPSQTDQNAAVQEAIARNFKSTSSTQITQRSTAADRFNSISRHEAEGKREAFLNYLQHVYPQHADAIAGRHQPGFANVSNTRLRTSYSSSEASSSFEPLVPAFESAYPGFVRGSRLRASLPIVRSDSRIVNRPRVVYLQYEGETRAAELPPELTGLDTIRALFVQSYPGLLTMPVLDKQRHGIMLKNTKTGKFEEIDNVKRIKDRSFIRARPRDGQSGIPMPGAKKPVAKANGNVANKINNRTGLPQNSNQNNNGHIAEPQALKKSSGYGPKSSYVQKPQNRSLVSSPASPRIGVSSPSSVPKANGNLRSFGYGVKPRIASPKVPVRNGTEKMSSPKANHERDANNNTNDAAELHSSGTSAAPDSQSPLSSPTGNGLGGGSVSKTGFSYVHGTGVPTYRNQSPVTVGSDISMNTDPSNSEPSSDNRTAEGPKTKLQPIGAPLRGEARKGSPTEGKRSIPAPKSKIYGSLLSSKLKNGKASGSSPASSSGNDSSEPDVSISSSKNQLSNASGLKTPQGKVPPPTPNRPKGFRVPGLVPPPTAPKPTASKLASMQSNTNSLPTPGPTTEVQPSNVRLVSAQVHSNEPLVDDDPPPNLSVFSNIKRPESPEPRATINGRGSSRSLRPKHMLKPVSIPQVPALEAIRRQMSDEVSKSDIDLRGVDSGAKTGENEPNLVKETSLSAPNLSPDHTWPLPPDFSHVEPEEAIKDDKLAPTYSPYSILVPAPEIPQEKPSLVKNKEESKEYSENVTSLKRGLSSLKRFIPGRSSTKQSKSQLPKTNKGDEVTKVVSVPVIPDKIHTASEVVEDPGQAPAVAEPPTAGPSVHSLASKFENDSTTPEGPNVIIPHNPNSTLKKPTIPTTSLVTHLIKNGMNSTMDRRSSSENSGSDSSQNNSNRFNQTSIVRKSNLVKTGSYTSVNSSDSSASNATGSSISQQKPGPIQKKVSFQDNVMVSDGRGANTYVQRLKTKNDDTGETASTDVKIRASAAEQLRIVATESDYKQYLNNHVMTSPGSTHFLPPANRVLSPGPHVTERKSAVEAAIETITGKPSSRKVNINDSYRAATQRPLTSSHHFVPSSPESMSTPMLVTGDGDVTYTAYAPPGYVHQQQGYKEMWYPTYGQAPSPTSYPQYSPQMRSVTPNHVTSYDQYPAAISAVGPSPTVAFSTVDQVIENTANREMSSQSNFSVSPEDLYFQTQSGFPHGNDQEEDGESWNIDATPYYERCGSWKRGTPAGVPRMDSHKPASNDLRSNRDPAANDGEDENLVAIPREGHGARPDAAPVDKATQERVKAMEQQIANLTGMVETMITHTDKEIDPNPSNKESKRPPGKGNSNDSSAPSRGDNSETMQEVRNEMLQLRETAKDLKKQLDDIKRQQRTNLERVADMLVTRSRELTSLIATTAGAEHAPVRARRLTLDRERSTYSDNASRTEHQLTDVEAAVEELRNEVVERRCRVNTREVEALALQLSQAGRTIADLKNAVTMTERVSYIKRSKRLYLEFR